MTEKEKEALEILKAYIGDDIGRVNEIRRELSALDQPVDHIIWVPCDQVHPNDYNPNAVAKKEMGLLKKSIQSDGYTQPIVTVQDEDGKYCIVDGFHRYFLGSNDPDIKAMVKGYLPIVVLEKDISDRMAATVRHNRARGKHSVVSMSSLVFKLLEAGRSEEDIANELGMEAEEVMRLKHITGYAKLYENHQFSKAYETPEMAKHRVDYLKEHPGENGVQYD
ncbi:hypothetical protein AGMMS49944_04140 [Spirochaetia bacterium]|nr:hypothetical protein AGMMS49944_04140 [Spirochaetia bacterium]